jgi:hypothetical protein
MGACRFVGHAGLQLSGITGAQQQRYEMEKVFVQTTMRSGGIVRVPSAFL